MKKIIALFLTFIISLSILQAQYPQFLLEKGDFFEYKRNLISNYELPKYQKLLDSNTKRNYDVLNYNLELDWTEALSSEPIKFEFYGKNNITIKITEPNINKIEFDAVNLLINSVFINDIPVSSFDYSEGLLSVPLDNFQNIGDTIDVLIDYKFVGPDTLGFYLYPKDMPVGYGPSGEMVYTQERIAYTMSEPEDARYWMPCNDIPNDKARASISIKVPKGFLAVSNGLLMNVDENEETVTYHWADTALIPTYLMAVAASKYVSYNEWFKYSDNQLDSIELVYYVWENDLDNEKTDWTVYNAKNAFKPTSKIMQIYSEAFIPYPFRKYGQVAIQPFYFGGMEHQTITFVNRSWLRGRNESGIAHEMAHQWIGDLVSCEDWSNIWFNEGGATWSEAIWAEDWGGYDTYLNYMDAVGNQYRSRKFLMTVPIYGIPNQYLFSFPFSLLVYNKASWVYHQLRIMLGDEVFFPTFRNLLRKYAFSNINVDKFQQHFEDEVIGSPVPLDVFFDQWLKKPGHPIYQLSAEADLLPKQNNYSVNVNLKQTQSSQNAHPLFVTYLPLVFFNKDTVSEIFVVNDQIEQSFTINLDFLPDSVYIDTRKVLAESNKVKVNLISSVDNSFSNVKIYPNIVEKNGFITISSADNSNIQIIELYNSVGEKLIKERPEKNFYQLSLRNLSSGVYYAVIYVDNNCVTQKIVVQ
ncbi:MAG: M1 family aminopeptidase [Bacteroidota bacterium]